MSDELESMLMARSFRGGCDGPALACERDTFFFVPMEDLLRFFLGAETRGFLGAGARVRKLATASSLAGSATALPGDPSEILFGDEGGAAGAEDEDSTATSCVGRARFLFAGSETGLTISVAEGATGLESSTGDGTSDSATERTLGFGIAGFEGFAGFDSGLAAGATVPPSEDLVDLLDTGLTGASGISMAGARLSADGDSTAGEGCSTAAA